MQEPYERVAREAVEFVAGRSAGGPLDRALRVTLNFHPDRLSDGVVMLDSLGRDGMYRNQFETGTSNGGMSASCTGGARWRWEHRIFGGAYDDVPAAARPKYGALNYRRRPTGAAPRFGSAHLRLAEHVLDRTTFCFPDSVSSPDRFGTAEKIDLERFARDFASAPRTEREEAELGGRLDDYIEAHVHGRVDLARDVEALVLDPCYRGTDVESIAERLRLPVEWHGGFRLAVPDLQRHPDFRGPEVVSLGTEIAEDGRLDAKIIGAAHKRPELDRQDLKYVWHLVARFGSPEQR